MVGLKGIDLSPSQIARRSSAPEMQQICVLNLFDVAVTDGEGSRVTAREAFAELTKRCVESVANLRNIPLSELTKEQRSELKLAQKTLSWTKELGLWQDLQRNQPDSQPKVTDGMGSVDSLLRSHRDLDGATPALRRRRPVTLDAPANGDFPLPVGEEG